MKKIFLCLSVFCLNLALAEEVLTSAEAPVLSKDILRDKEELFKLASKIERVVFEMEKLEADVKPFAEKDFETAKWMYTQLGYYYADKIKLVKLKNEKLDNMVRAYSREEITLLADSLANDTLLESRLANANAKVEELDKQNAEKKASVDTREHRAWIGMRFNLSQEKKVKDTVVFDLRNRAREAFSQEALNVMSKIGALADKANPVEGVNHRKLKKDLTDSPK